MGIQIYPTAWTASAWKASPRGSNSFWPSSIPSRRRGDTEWSCRVLRFFFRSGFFFLRRPKLWMLQTTRRWGSTADFGDVELRCGFGDGMATLKTQRLSCLHFTQSSTLLFDFELIQVPNFQKLSWNRIYPEAPPPKKLTAFGNLEDVKPPCQLLGIPATARPTCSSVLNQLLSQSWGRCCRCDGLMMGDGRKDGGGD